ncbi:MAG: alpha/beta hydrolase [Zoogloeaceae bacterium]|jgi:alpha/beta superfamily hydrolase|nr:alpha/beta hydrolase [Zoogloeaceae bacterium]
MHHESHIHFDGPVGNIEAIMEIPADLPLRGIALVAHPHPAGGGANTNKVAHTLAKTFRSLGYAAFRPNFRGVGKTEGVHDGGLGETDDLLATLEEAHRRLEDPNRCLPVTLAGFSFGAYCQTLLARRLRDAGRAAERLALVGVAAGFIEGVRAYDTEAVPADTLIIHGADDTLVPLANVLAWAEPQNLPVVVIPGADHFFHRRLTLIRDIILRAWHDRARDLR